MDTQEFLQSKKFKCILAVIAGLIILLLVFQLGVFVGLRKARFSYQWGDNYHRVFGGPRGGFMRDFQGRDFISGHGTAGTIAKIDGNTIVIKGRDGVEKSIVTTDKTTIKNGGADIKVSDLKVDESVVVIGSPNADGSINAEIVRVFDPGQSPHGMPGPMGGFMPGNSR